MFWKSSVHDVFRGKNDYPFDSASLQFVERVPVGRPSTVWIKVWTEQSGIRLYTVDRHSLVPFDRKRKVYRRTVMYITYEV